MSRQGTRGFQIIERHIGQAKADQYNATLTALGSSDSYTVQQYQLVAATILRDEELVEKLTRGNEFNRAIIGAIVTHIDRAIRMGRELGYLDIEDQALSSAKETIQNANNTPYNPETNAMAPEPEPAAPPTPSTPEPVEPTSN